MRGDFVRNLRLGGSEQVCGGSYDGGPGIGPRLDREIVKDSTTLAMNGSVFDGVDIGELTVELASVEAVADDKFIGQGEADVVGGHGHSASARFVQQ